jgi:hypothetical protein
MNMMLCCLKHVIYKISKSLCLLFVFLPSLKAEILETWDMIYLTLHSEEIWEAVPVKRDSLCFEFEGRPSYGRAWIKVQITKVVKSSRFKAGDEVHVYCGFSCNWLDKPHQPNNQYNMADTASIEKILVYANTYDEPSYFARPIPMRIQRWVAATRSGFHVSDNKSRTHIPIQVPDSNSPYSFYWSPMYGFWDRHIADAFFYRRKIDTLTALIEIKNPDERGNAILKWIKSHRQELLGKDSSFNWTGYSEIPFQAVLRNPAERQAWEAVELYHTMFPGEFLFPNHWTGILSDFPEAFQHYKGQRLLFQKLTYTTLPADLRLKAFLYLCQLSYAELIMQNLIYEWDDSVIYALSALLEEGNRLGDEDGKCIKFCHRLGHKKAMRLFKKLYEKQHNDTERRSILENLSKYYSAAEIKSMGLN